MTPQEQQIIESLFQRLTQGAAQSGPRDPQAEALIQQRVASIPGAAYYMAQTMIMQERALQQAEARLAQQGGGQGSFLPGGATAQPYPYASAPGGYGAPPPAYQQPQGGGMGGFLAGAGKVALGVGGGILVADAAMGLAHDLFGQHDSDTYQQAYDQGYQQGFDRGDQQGFDQGDQQGFPQGDQQGLFDNSSDQQDQSYDQQGDYQQDDFDQSGDGGQGW